MNTIQQAHILLVDDNTDLLRLLEEQLRGAGYQNIRTMCRPCSSLRGTPMPTACSGWDWVQTIT